MRRPQQQNISTSLGIAILFVGIWLIPDTAGQLLFPTSTVLQLTSSMSVPIDLANRKVFMDLGFQMNYNLPFDPASFYNPAIWANAYERRRRRRHVDEFTGNVRQVLDIDNEIHPNDFTAGEFYAGIENRLEDYGFHRSCLLRSVCELALHPLEENYSHSYNLIIQIISFVLTPSQHEGFGPNEKLYQHRYERAEKLGFMGHDCQRAYPKCELDVLNIFTKIIS